MKIHKHPDFALLSSPDWVDYELLDSGSGAKLERFGPYSFVRPEPQAIWRPALPQGYWEDAHALFQGTEDKQGGRWQVQKTIDPRWVMTYKDLRFFAEATPFRHLGVFPEQANHWDWMRARITNAQRPVNILNLFGYTGIATLAAAAAGARVTHVDASKKVVAWAQENQRLSSLTDLPIRWIVDDALKFVQREVRRQVRYDGIIIDPPKFGRGPKGEVWKLEESLPVLLEACRALLSQQPLFVVLTVYAFRISALSLYYTLDEMFAGFGGSITAGEMTIVEKSASRLLSTAIFARWTRETRLPIE